jgi:hypothetical protein
VSVYPIPFALVEKVENGIAYRIALGSTPRAIAEDILSSIIPATKDECATEGCGKPAAVHFIRGDVGSYFCADCYKRVHAGEIDRLAALSAQDTDGVAKP